jgi:2-keto-3-deoxy-L-rhamnonate aldolase RhmA
VSPGLRERLADGDALLGTFVKSSDPMVSELLAGAGFDFLIVDCEHSTLALADVAAIVRGASVPVVVRLPPERLHDAGRLVEAGAAGIQVPDVGATEAVARARSELRPSGRDGGRMGLALTHRAARFGATTAVEYVERVELQTLVVAQIESGAAVEALPRLLEAQPGADVWFLGPTDLSLDLGRPGELGHPDVEAALERAATLILAAGARLGVFAIDAADAARWSRRGASYVAVASDLALLAGSARAVVGRWQDQSEDHDRGEQR